jgi:phosphoglycolate phosphatase
MNTPPWFSRLRAVLFDLDGTLADTGPDLAAALDRVLREEGRDSVPYLDIRPYISHGALAMVLRAFDLEPGDPAAEAFKQRMVAYYSQAIARHTRLFPDMHGVLDRLEKAGLRWGVVTNKPAWLSEPLMRELGLSARACCIVSGDTLSEKKPHPAPILHACALAKTLPAECLYVGDAEKDIQAGQRAGTRTAVALFGYLGTDDHPHAWGADTLFDSPRHLLDCLQRTFAHEKTLLLD